MSTWGGGPVPTSSDDVIIASGTTVDVDINGAACNNLAVNGTAGIYQHRRKVIASKWRFLVNNRTGTLQVSAAFSSGGHLIFDRVWEFYGRRYFYRIGGWKHVGFR